MRVLVVEDEPNLRGTLLKQCQSLGWVADGAADGDEGLYQASEVTYDALIIDLGLPKTPGMEVIKALRARGIGCPILVLTARDLWQEKVNALQSGADDYVCKPFQFEEVSARIQALVRRAAGRATAVWQVGDIALNTLTQHVSVCGVAIELTSYEYRILEYLMRRPGEVCSKAELTEQLYAQDFDRDSNTIEVLVGRLRRKLDPTDVIHPIETVRGRGYRLFSRPATVP